MVYLLKTARLGLLPGVLMGVLALTGCATDYGERGVLPTASGAEQFSTRYRIAPGDSITIFVWRNPEVSGSFPVRPDGVLSTPLLGDIPAVGRTPDELARELEEELSTYLRDPLVTVIVGGFVGNYEEQIRILGATENWRTVLYKDGMTLLDLMIDTGGITDFADGNNATLFRDEEGERKAYRLRLDDLVRDADLSANVDMKPGDIVIIPESWF